MSEPNPLLTPSDKSCDLLACVYNKGYSLTRDDPASAAVAMPEYRRITVVAGVKSFGSLCGSGHRPDGDEEAALPPEGVAEEDRISDSAAPGPGTDDQDGEVEVTDDVARAVLRYCTDGMTDEQIEAFLADYGGGEVSAEDLRSYLQGDI
jgi:hypothetical protein